MTVEKRDFAAKRLFDICKRILGEIGEIVSDKPEEYHLEADIEAEPFDVHLKIEVKNENGFVSILSVLPYEVPKERSAKFAQFITNLNYEKFYLGTFDYSPERGKVVFRVSVIFRESIISEETLDEVIKYAVAAVIDNNEEIFNATREE